LTVKEKLFRLIGIVGTAAVVVSFWRDPNFPTPDILIVLATFVFMIFGQAKEMLKHLLPFVVLLLAYDSFRSLVPGLNGRVEYYWMINADKWLFGSLPTKTLQGWLWHGHIQWYDFVFYLAYMMHFVIPIGLALVVWKQRAQAYWQYVSTYLLVSLMGFVTFFALPAAPPWLAAQNGYIAPIQRISSHVWYALGIQDFPSLYNKLSPNPVAAMPSLHAAYATLMLIFIYKLFGRRWGLLAALYPFLIFVGTVYMGEHYAIDELAGIIYALVGYGLVSWLFGRWQIEVRAADYWRSQMSRWQTGY
jgi:hypothetical protein